VRPINRLIAQTAADKQRSLGRVKRETFEDNGEEVSVGVSAAGENRFRTQRIERRSSHKSSPLDPTFLMARTLLVVVFIVMVVVAMRSYLPADFPAAKFARMNVGIGQTGSDRLYYLCKFRGCAGSPTRFAAGKFSCELDGCQWQIYRDSDR
jgi:hypothetical protein